MHASFMTAIKSEHEYPTHYFATYVNSESFMLCLTFSKVCFISFEIVYVFGYSIKILFVLIN